MAKPIRNRPVLPVKLKTGSLRLAKANQVQRKTVVDLTVEELRKRILHGEYAEGSALRQDALAGDLGVSRIPVREALRQLEVEGLVTFSPHAGAVVSTLSLDEISELFELRAMLEADLMRRAVPNLTGDDLDRAASILEAYDHAFETGEVSEWGALNWEFHATLLSAANRPRTLNILSMLHNQGDVYTRMQLALTHGESRASEEHKAIARAAGVGDSALAAQLLKTHVETAGRSLIDFLRKHRENTSTAEE
jgi:DNA-binding GntR family transcriptional regulator